MQNILIYDNLNKQNILQYLNRFSQEIRRKISKVEEGRWSKKKYHSVYA